MKKFLPRLGEQGAKRQGIQTCVEVAAGEQEFESSRCQPNQEGEIWHLSDHKVAIAVTKRAIKQSPFHDCKCTLDFSRHQPEAVASQAREANVCLSLHPTAKTRV